MRFVIGSYTDSYSSFRAVGDGLTLVELDAAGGLRQLDCLRLVNPSYVLPLGSERVAVTIETDDDRAAVALVDIRGDALHLAGSVAAPGRVPCHLDLHPDGRWLGSACYGSGEVFAVPLGPDGEMVGGGVVTTRHHGTSVHPVRQTKPHPHAARFSPDGRWLVVPDLGIDEVRCYPFDAIEGPDFSAPQIWTAPPGSGPRLPLFSADGRHLVLVEEMASAVAVLGWDDSRLVELSRHSSLIAPCTMDNTASGIRWHPSGKLLGVSNRGADSIALFHYEAETGRLSPWREVTSGGVKPRDFTFSACGKWLLTTNQNSDCVAVYALDLAAERVEGTGQSFEVRSPSCIRQLPDPAA